MQKPGVYDLGNGKKCYPYLMLFENGERVDLKIAAIDALEVYLNMESTVQIIVDLDNRIKNKLQPNESSFFLQKPTEEAFLMVVNEFFWVVPSIVKGCLRQQFLYAVQHLEIIRTQLIQVISWEIAEQYQYQVNLGSHQKYLQKYMTKEKWEQLIASYNCEDYEQMKESLFLLIDLMAKEAKKLANIYGYTYSAENDAVILYAREKLVEKRNNQNSLG